MVCLKETVSETFQRYFLQHMIKDYIITSNEKYIVLEPGPLGNVWTSINPKTIQNVYALLGTECPFYFLLCTYYSEGLK